MSYQIEQKNDLMGASLVVSFPEEDLDRKALYTLQADMPEFLIPFQYRSVDGKIECTYQLGSHSKLQYRFGNHHPKAYVDLWKQLLRPLMECGDWFLQYSSFVLEPQYLYTDRTGKHISYLYIPAKADNGGSDRLRKMLLYLSERNTATDPALENKVLKALMQNFQPAAFLRMLEDEDVSDSAAVAESVPEKRGFVPEPVEDRRGGAYSDAIRQEAAIPQLDRMIGGEDDIIIQVSEKKEDWLFGLFGSKNKKKKEDSGHQKNKASLFGEKKESIGKEIILGAGAEQSVPPAQVQAAACVMCQNKEEDMLTDLEEPLEEGAHLRLVGDPSLPRSISVYLQPGQSFTIGRFDVSVGYAQSSFEFDKKTKGVSRHHAAIDRTAEGEYTLVDLSSRAGTYLNGRRITPNVPERLSRGCRITFGTSSVDYIWEE